MKVAHLTTVDLSLRYLVLPQLEAAAELGDVYGISAPGPHVGELERLGIHHVTLPASTRGMSPLNDLRAALQFWRAIRALRPDVLHTHNPKPGVYGRIFGRLAGVPIVVNTVHGLYATTESPTTRRLVVYTLEAFASRFSDAELIQNPEDLELLRRKRIVPAGKLRLLGNGVDLTKFNQEARSRSRSDERARLGLGPSDVAVGMVGRLVAEKGIPELVEAASMMHPRVRVFVAGPADPEKGDALAQQLLDSGREAGISFLGMKKDIERFYSALDVFVLPSHREGFPRAAMEAAASGLPLILTDIRGCRQVVDDGVNGILVDVRDPKALAAAVNRLAAEPALREDMGQASAKKAAMEFDENRVVEIVMRTYAGLAKAKGLGWKLPGESGQEIRIRPATVDDSRSVALLHAEMISNGFLSSLGPRFLALLYRTLIESDEGLVFVAESKSGVVGFVAGSGDTGRFYRDFILRRGLRAIVRLIPALLRLRTWWRIWETARYGAGFDDGVSSELLSMAVAPTARRRGLGSRLVGELTDTAVARSIDRMKVVVGADNHAAIALYESCGFLHPRSMEVHSGERSVELVWQPSVS